MHQYIAHVCLNDIQVSELLYFDFDLFAKITGVLDI